jgi:hypothetical protein
MLFDLQLLGKLDAAGNVDVIENRTLAAASVEEAVRTAKDIVLNNASAAIGPRTGLTPNHPTCGPLPYPHDLF